MLKGKFRAKKEIHYEIFEKNTSSFRNKKLIFIQQQQQQRTTGVFGFAAIFANRLPANKQESEQTRWRLARARAFIIIFVFPSGHVRDARILRRQLWEAHARASVVKGGGEVGVGLKPPGLSPINLDPTAAHPRPALFVRAFLLASRG